MFPLFIPPDPSRARDSPGAKKNTPHQGEEHLRTVTQAVIINLPEPESRFEGVKQTICSLSQAKPNF